MKIRDLMTHDFVMLDADWTRKAALDVSSTFESGYVVIRDAIDAGDADFYLLAIEEFQEKLKRSRKRRIANILNLSSLDPVYTFVMDAPLEAGTPRGIVLDAGEPIGVFDPLTSEAADAGSRSDPSAWSYEEVLESSTEGGPRGGGGNDGGLSRGSGNNGGSSEGGGPSVGRNLIGDLASTVKVRSPISLAVTLTARAVSGRNVAGFKVPVGTKVDIIVNPVERLRLDGTATTSLDVQEPQPDKTFEFKLVADEVGPGRVEVCAFHAGASIATLELITNIVEVFPPLQRPRHKSCRSPWANARHPISR